MNVDLNGQVALVTGAARGIGLATADLLAANGARVVYADVDAAGAAAAAARTPGASSLALDVSQESQVEAGVDQVVAEHGRLDLVVNNAGINTMRHRVNIDQFPLDEWNRIVAVDLTGLFLVSRAASRHLIARQGGRIV
ncbi:MAG: SDR family NAD(P)-dependent oxidoreductase, partial [Verrucomicrobiota bacterium]